MIRLGTRTLAAAGLCLSVSALPAAALTGEQYFDLSEIERIAYVSGLIDGYALFASGKPAEISCIESRTYTEMHGAFENWLQLNPDRWRMNGGPLFALAVIEICAPRDESDPL